MSTASTLGLCLLTVLAGCTGAIGLPPGDGVENPPLPPGVTQDGVNVGVLFNAHVDSLANRSYAFKYEITSSEAGSGTVIGEIGPNRRRAVVRIERGPEIEGYYVTSDARYEVDRVGDRTRYAVRNESSTADSEFVRRYVRPTDIQSVVGAGEWTTDGTTDCAAGTCWALRATGIDSSGELTDANALDGRVVVTSSGRVVRTAITVHSPNETVELRYRLDDVGTTTVERPEWVSAAERSAANRSGTPDGFGSETTSEPSARRVKEDLFDRNGSVTVVGVGSDADRSDLETSPIALGPNNPVVNATVGWFVGVDFAGPYEYGLVRLDYDESRIPEGGTGSELAPYRMNETTGRFARLDAAHRPAGDVFEARVGNVTGIYVVFHEPTLERVRNETRA